MPWRTQVEAPGRAASQLLDHATGYLAAAGALLAVAEQRHAGGTPYVRLSLLGTAQWLLDLPRAAPADVDDTDTDADADADLYLQQLGPYTLAAPPGTVDGRPMRWPEPAPSSGTAAPEWLPG